MNARIALLLLLCAVAHSLLPEATLCSRPFLLCVSLPLGLKT